MRESLDEPVSVAWYYQAEQHHLKPYVMHWRGRDYRLGKVDFYHKSRVGESVIHHFSMADADGQVYVKLACDSDTLHWTIEEFMNAGDVAVTYGTTSP